MNESNTTPIYSRSECGLSFTFAPVQSPVSSGRSPQRCAAMMFIEARVPRSIQIQHAGIIQALQSVSVVYICVVRQPLLQVHVLHATEMVGRLGRVINRETPNNLGLGLLRVFPHKPPPSQKQLQKLQCSIVRTSLVTLAIFWPKGLDVGHPALQAAPTLRRCAQPLRLRRRSDSTSVDERKRTSPSSETASTDRWTLGVGLECLGGP